MAFTLSGGVCVTYRGELPLWGQRKMMGCGPTETKPPNLMWPTAVFGVWALPPGLTCGGDFFAGENTPGVGCGKPCMWEKFCPNG